MKETREQATKRLLTEVEPGKKLPMRRYEKKELQIACVQRGDDGEFHLNLGENIWGMRDPDSPSGGLTYERLENLVKDGWEID